MLYSWDFPTNITLINISDIIIVSYLQDILMNPFFDVWPSGHYLRMFCIRQYVICIYLVRNRKLCLRLSLLSKTLFNVGLFTIWLYLISASLGWCLEILSEIHSYVSLEVLYIFRKFPTNLLLLVDIRAYIRYLYLSGSTISI